MGIFGRKKNQPTEPEEDLTPQVPEGEPGVDRDWERVHDGPYDIGEQPEAGGRVNLGALQVPAIQGMQMRLDTEKKSTKIIGVTCTIGASKLQLQAFAAPRSEGLWDDIREGLVEGIRTAGGTADIAEDSVLGQELLARMPSQDSTGKAVYQVNRFFGVDGPRWFLRGVLNGPATSDTAQLGVIRTFLRQVIVDRGSEPRPPREVLELTAPEGVREEAARRRQARLDAAKAAQARPEGGSPSGGAPTDG